MHTVFVVPPKGEQISKNSMFEEASTRLGLLKGACIESTGDCQREMVEIPPYLGQNTDITGTPLYRYLHGDSK